MPLSAPRPFSPHTPPHTHARRYDTLKPILAERALLSTDAEFELLLAGCGNSALPARLSADGVQNISAVDHSTVVISQMLTRFADALPEADFSVADVCDPVGSAAVLPTAVFDVVLDKGCLDAVLCGEDAFARVGAMVANMHRVLKPGGRYVLVTFGAPDQRMAFLTSVRWAGAPEVVQVQAPQLLKGQGAQGQHYVYIARKPL